MNIDTGLMISVFVPIGLALMMFGLGLALTLEDFRRVKQQPRAVLVGLFVQLFVSPVFAYILVKIFALSPYYAIGLLLLSAAPGGPSANLYSNLAGGEVALNVTLTAINSLIAIIYVPAVVSLSYLLMLGSQKEIPPQFLKLFQVLLLIGIPMGLGMWARSRKPGFANAMIPFIKKASILFLIFLTTFGFYNEKEKLMAGLGDLAVVVFVFNVGCLLLGFYVSKLMKLTFKQNIAITIELGLHNCAMILAIALSPQLLNNTDVALPSALYAIMMQFTIGFTAYLFHRQQKVGGKG